LHLGERPQDSDGGGPLADARKVTSDAPNRWITIANKGQRMIFYVAVGSAAGGVARYLLSSFVQQRVGAGFPLGTLLVNVTGSFLLGLFWRYALGSQTITPEVRLLLTTGFCGGYTTFSTFSYETVVLLEDGEWPRAATYVILSVVLSLAGVWLGFLAARELLAARMHG
jgi:CrcB protein